MKINKLIKTLFFCMFLAVGFAFFNISLASADESSEVSYEIKEIVQSILGNKKIKTCEYLKSLDEAQNYVYVVFKESGYAIFDRETKEMLEYSQSKLLPYDFGNDDKYYAGPSNYYTKFNEQYFFNINKYEDDFNYLKSPPVYDKDNLISANPPGAINTTYISNVKYFTEINPIHGVNIHGTCGSVAAQLLLSYNNYYNDRRIISSRYLNGGWKEENNNGDVNDLNNYATPYYDPNFCLDPRTLTSYIAGSNDEFYNYVINCVEPGAMNCCSGKDSENEHSHKGSSLDMVKRGLQKILNEKIPNNYNINGEERLYSIGSEKIKAEIDSGRPLIIGMKKRLGGIDHWAVGYGYQDYTYPEDSSKEGETYFGYIVNLGWGSNASNVWINEKWCNSYISLRTNHIHDYNIDTGVNLSDAQRVLKCEECGHRTVKDILIVDDNGVITGGHYQLSGGVDIPEYIDGKTVTGIANYAFANNNLITQIGIPDKLRDIGNSAFV